MRPAFSVIFLTTLIGTGQGLFLALMTAQTYSLIELVPVYNPTIFYGLGSVLSLIFLLVGLGASFFHLGKPSRSWRTISGWRTSWMSREVIVLPMTIFLIFIYGAIHYFQLDITLLQINSKIPINLSFVIGILAVFSVLLLFLCTAMIYVAIKFIQEWSNPLTIINYTMFGLSSGFGVATIFSSIQSPNLTSLFIVWTIVFIILSVVARVSSLIRNAKLKPKSTPKSAIGIRHNKIRQITQGAMGGSFNTREYFHGKTKFIMQFTKWFFIIMVFLVPLLLLLYSIITNRTDLLLSLVISQHLGLIIERWYFFADANHPQNIYYQAS